MPVDWSNYPTNWKETALAVKIAADWKCQQCGKQCRRPGEPFDTHRNTLTVAHLNHDPGNEQAELKAMCSPCHLRYDAHSKAERRVLASLAKRIENQKELLDG